MGNRKDKKKTDRKQYMKSEQLPSLLVEKLRNTVFADKKSYSPTKNNFLKCVSLIHYHQVRNSIGINNYVPLGSEFWKTVYGGNYHEKVIKPLLLEHQIIESHDFGYRTYPNPESNPNRGKQDGLVGIRYRIKPELLNDKFEHIDYLPTNRVRTSEEIELADGLEFVIPEIPNKSFRVSIDKLKASKWVDENAQRICEDMLNRDFIDSLPDSLKVQCKELINVKGEWSYNVKYRNVSAALLRAETHGKELFYFNGDFYIADVDEFLRQRIELLKYSYKQSISKLGLQPIEEKQNLKTLRLYSDLTNFPSRILQYININNKTVVQLDLRTSQFLLFANLLNTYLKTGEQGLLKQFQANQNITYLKKLAGILKQHQNQLPEVGVDIGDENSGEDSLYDVTQFIRDVFFSDFYTVVQEELGFNDRLLAKHTMFKLLFKKTNKRDALLDMLRERYPVVMSIITEFKKQKDEEKQDSSINTKGNDQESNFSVFLSCIEGEVFVNNILSRLRDSGIPSFTRHDSVVVARGYEELADAIVRQVFDEFGFMYNLKEDDMFYDFVDSDKLYPSKFMEWLIDENEINQEIYGESESQEQEKMNIDIMNEDHRNTLSRLSEVGIRDDYYGLLGSDMLEELVEILGLNQSQSNIFYDEVNNQNDGMPFFQDKTNALLREIIEYYCLI